MTPTQKLERVVKALMALFFFVPAAMFLESTLAAFWDPDSPLQHFRAPPVPPHVLVRGTLASAPRAALPPLCEVRWQRWQACGKSPCWVTLAELNAAPGTLDVAWSSVPVPAKLRLATAWTAEPGLEGSVVTDGNRAAAWLAEAKVRAVDLRRVTDQPGQDRLLERCVADGAPLYARACVQGTELGPCPGRPSYALVPSATPVPALKSAADALAFTVGAELFLLLVGALLLIPPRGALVDVLAARAGRGLQGLGAAWWLVLLPLGGALWNVLAAADRGGLVVLFTAALAWSLTVKHLVSRRLLLEAALRPIVSIARSPLAHASGTAELSVCAKLVGRGAPRMLREGAAAYVETRVVQHYGTGKTKLKTEPVTFPAARELHVVDESSDGVLNLEHSMLDVKVEELTCDELPPRLAAHGHHLPRQEPHAYWTIEERSIEDGERLFVIGEVSDIRMRHDGLGYRSVVGSPKLGGAGAAPVVVFSGDERGVVAGLRREGRFVVGLALACGAVVLAALALAGVLAVLSRGA